MNMFKDGPSPGSPTPNSESLRSGMSVVPGREKTTTDEESGEGFVAETRKAFDAGRAMQKAREVKADMVETSQNIGLRKLEGIASLDWKNIPPPMLAQMLIQIPFKGSGSDPDYYLSPVQAMIFAMRCFELGLSPFSNEVWFNPKNNKVNVTFEGKLKLARMNGMNLSPPRFTRLPEAADKPLVAYKCVIKSPSGDSEYTAYLKDWEVKTSPVWKAKPEHMLQLRAAEKCLSFATGAGASELPDERDLEVGTEVKQVLPTIEVSGGVK